MSISFRLPQTSVASPFLFSFFFHMAVAGVIVWHLPMSSHTQLSKVVPEPLVVSMVFEPAPIAKASVASEPVVSEPIPEEENTSKRGVKKSEVTIKKLDPIKKQVQKKRVEKVVAKKAYAAPAIQETSKNKVAASQAAFGKASYHQKVRQWLARHKHYPLRARRRGTEGRVMMHITIARDGAVLSHHITESSGSSVLDRAAVATVEKASPLPAMPASLVGESFSFTIPFGFFLKDEISGV